MRPFTCLKTWGVNKSVSDGVTKKTLWKWATKVFSFRLYFWHLLGRFKNCKLCHLLHWHASLVKLYSLTLIWARSGSIRFIVFYLTSVRLIKAHLSSFRFIRADLDSVRFIQAQLNLFTFFFDFIQDLLALFRIFGIQVGLFKIIWAHMGSLRTALDYLGSL